MSNNAKSTSSGGVGVAGLLGVAFVVLKLCGVIDWPWLWVLSPFWISTGLVLIAVIVMVIIYLVGNRQLK